MYDGKEVVTPIYINAITPLDELDLSEGAGRETTANINVSIKGIFHSYINGLWREVLDYYRQFKLIDSDGDGILDAYLHPRADGVDECGRVDPSEEVVPIKLGSECDKAWVKTTLAFLAEERGVELSDLLSKPEFDLSKIGEPIIEKVLLRVHEERVTAPIIQELLVLDEHTTRDEDEEEEQEDQ
jgi:hypothetical protein